MDELIEIRRTTDILYVYWALTDYCNFRCHYCPDPLHSGKHAGGELPGFPTDVQIEKFLDNLVNVHLNGRLLNITISGGEPTVHTKFSRILEVLHPYGITEVVTNGSRPINWWKKLPTLPNFVILSLHPEFTDINRINELGLFLQDSGVSLQINLICDPLNWKITESFLENLAEGLHQYTIPKALNHIELRKKEELEEDWGRLYDYTPAQLAFINNFPRRKTGVDSRKLVELFRVDGSKQWLNVFSLIAKNENRFRNWKCSAGVDGIKVNYDGKVYSGICAINYLGQLDNFELEKDWITCTRNQCPCPADILLSKKR